MKAACVIVLAGLVVVGCATAPPPPPEKDVPSPASRNYDLLWDATRDVVEEHFELFVQRKDEGYMVSSYKRGEPLPGEYRRDAQTGYDTVEELMHVVRRRLTARVLEDYPGVYVVHLEIIRERQGYVPPSRDFASSYSLYDHGKSGLDASADLGETVTWYRLGRDVHLEQTMLRRIQDHLNPQPR